MKKVRILIADDHDIVRHGLRMVLEAQPDWEVCGEARDGREAVRLAAELRPHVAVLDLVMPEIEGVEATRQIKKVSPETEVLAFTGAENEDLVRQVFAAGARACVLKTDIGELLIPAIRALCAHQPFVGTRVSQLVLERHARGETAPKSETFLTPREREIVRALAEGRSNKEVAATLGISVKTVETHRATIMRKLHFTAFSQLVRYAVRNGLVAP